MNGKPMTASQREAAKAQGMAEHPSDGLADPPAAQLADLPTPTERKRPPKIKHLGGSNSDAFNASIANAAVETCWLTGPNSREKAVHDVGTALTGINPQDELEGMLAGQLVAANAAAMECFRRAMLANQTLDGRAMNLNQANKASRTYVTLLEALDRHRGKGGQQRVTVEHVHIHEGGQAIVGHVQGPGGGARTQISRQSHETALSHTPQSLAPVWSEDQERGPVSITGDAERPLPNARRPESRCTKG